MTEHPHPPYRIADADRKLAQGREQIGSLIEQWRAGVGRDQVKVALEMALLLKMSRDEDALVWMAIAAAQRLAGRED